MLPTPGLRGWGLLFVSFLLQLQAPSPSLCSALCAPSQRLHCPSSLGSPAPSSLPCPVMLSSASSLSLSIYIFLSDFSWTQVLPILKIVRSPSAIFPFLLLLFIDQLPFPPLPFSTHLELPSAPPSSMLPLLPGQGYPLPNSAHFSDLLSLGPVQQAPHPYPCWACSPHSCDPTQEAVSSLPGHSFSRSLLIFLEPAVSGDSSILGPFPLGTPWPHC